MQVNVDINAEQINQMVADAILGSVIGESLRKAIEEAVKDLSKTYDNPLKKLVQEEIKRQLVFLLQGEYADQIREAVKGHLTEEVVNEAAKAAWDSFYREIERSQR